MRTHRQKRALVLTARKLVRLVVRLLTTNQPYQPRKEVSSSTIRTNDHLVIVVSLCDGGTALLPLGRSCVSKNCP